MGGEQFDQLGEVGERAGQAVDLVDHDNIDPAVPDVRQQPVQRRSLGRTAGIAAIVITGADQGPAVMGLTADVGFRRLVLGVEGVELLVEPVLGRDPGIDRTADPLGRFDRQPVSPCAGRRSEAGPAGAGHGERDLRQAAIGGAVPGKALVQDHDALGLAVPLAHQDGSRMEAMTGEGVGVATEREACFADIEFEVFGRRGGRIEHAGGGELGGRRNQPGHDHGNDEITRPVASWTEHAVEADVTQRAEHGGDMAVRQRPPHDDVLSAGRRTVASQTACSCRIDTTKSNLASYAKALNCFAN
jgi:hypothetical protein